MKCICGGPRTGRPAAWVNLSLLRPPHSRWIPDGRASGSERSSRPRRIRCRGTRDLTHQHVEHQLVDVRRVADRRQRHRQRRGEHLVVEAGDRDVFRHAHARLVKHAHAPSASESALVAIASNFLPSLIARCANRRRRAGSSSAARASTGPARATSASSGSIPAFSSTARAPRIFRAAEGVVRTLDQEQKLPPADVEQVPDLQPRARLAVDADLRRVDRHRRVDRDQRHPLLDHLPRIARRSPGPTSIP